MTALPRFAVAAVAAVALAGASAAPAHAQYVRTTVVVGAPSYVYPAPVVTPYVSPYSVSQPAYVYPAPAVGYSVSSYYAPAVVTTPYTAYRVDYYGRRRVGVTLYGVTPYPVYP